MRWSCTKESSILEELSVELEVESGLKDLHLIHRDVLKLFVEAGDSFVDTRLVGEEGRVGAQFLDLCRAGVVEVKAIVKSRGQTFH